MQGVVEYIPHPLICYLTTWCHLLITLHLVVAFSNAVWWRLRRAQPTQGATSSRRYLKPDSSSNSQHRGDETTKTLIITQIKESSCTVTINETNRHDKYSVKSESSQIPLDDSNKSNSTKLCVDGDTAGEVTNTRWSHSLPFSVKCSWILFNMCTGTTPVVSAVYFCVLYPQMHHSLSFYDMQTHAVTLLVVIIELFVSSFPVRILHFIHASLFGFSYVLFSIFFWLADREHHILYGFILNWNKPIIGCTVACVTVCVVIPIAQLFVFLIYRTRICIFKQVYGVWPN